MRATITIALLFAVGCRSTATDYVKEQEGYRVHSGYVIQLANLQDPKVVPLKDGKAFHVTTEGSTLVLESGRRRRTTFELVPGDIFVQSRPFSYLLQAPRTRRTPDPESRP